MLTIIYTDIKMDYFLHITGGDYTNGYFPSILDIFSCMSLILGVFVITTKNPVISVLVLIGLFFSIACYLISIGVSFIGISYLLVYVGAVSILFLFILMLINIRVSELVTQAKSSAPFMMMAAIIFGIAGYVILPVESTFYDNLIRELKSVTHNNWEGNLIEFNHVVSIGNIMYTTYNILLLLTSVILLLAMVGAIVITIKDEDFTIYEEKSFSKDLDESNLLNKIVLENSFSLHLKYLVNLIIKFTKYSVIIGIKLFTILFFILCEII